MRISDWSSDVCSSDLLAFRIADHAPAGFGGRFFSERNVDRAAVAIGHAIDDREILLLDLAAFEGASEAAVRLGIAREEQAARGVEIGRASCRERVCQEV